MKRTCGKRSELNGPCHRIGILDMAPTLTGLLGVDAPEAWQGRNLAAAILDRQDDAVESLPLFSFLPSWRGVYTRRHTFALEQIERTADLQTRLGSDFRQPRAYTPSYNVLYDRTEDPLQLNNLVNSTEHMEQAIELTRLTHEWCRRFDDPFLSYERMMDLVGERDDIPPIEQLIPLTKTYRYE